MTRILPHPLTSAALFALWLLLNETIAPGPALVGAIVAVVAGWGLALLVPPVPARPRFVRRVGIALRLLGVVTFDVMRSNLTVAWLILARPAGRHSGFVDIPLTLRDTKGLAVLAIILTAAPGSAWIDYDAETGVLLVHVLDLSDEAAWISFVKEHYEAPLKEIFE